MKEGESEPRLLGLGGVRRGACKRFASDGRVTGGGGEEGPAQQFLLLKGFTINAFARAPSARL